MDALPSILKQGQYHSQQYGSRGLGTLMALMALMAAGEDFRRSHQCSVP